MVWNPLLDHLKDFETCVGILLIGKLKGLDITFHILNIYGWCSNRICFWDLVKSFGLLPLPHLILAGELNFTWSSNEVWGAGHSLNPLLDYFSSLFGDA